MRRMWMFGLAILVGVTTGASGAVQADNFNDGMTGDIWRREVEVVKLREANGKLQTRSTAAGPGGERGSGYAARGWKFDFTENYTITTRYRLRPDPITGSRRAELGVVILPSGDIECMAFLVRRDANGIKVVFEVYNTNGNLINFGQKTITASQGKLTVRYRQSADRLDILIDDVVVLRGFNFLQTVSTGNGRANLLIGAGRRGRQTWGWNDVWLDNFKLTGRIFD